VLQVVSSSKTQSCKSQAHLDRQAVAGAASFPTVKRHAYPKYDAYACILHAFDPAGAGTITASAKKTARAAIHQACLANCQPKPHTSSQDTCSPASFPMHARSASRPPNTDNSSTVETSSACGAQGPLDDSAQDCRCAMTI
jgi:hypothetical protein